MKILIVDDDINTVEVIREEINWEHLGIEEVYQAYNVSGAQEIIRKEYPEIILCDIEMPMGSGIDLLKWIRENEIQAEFVFLTCHESFEFATSAIEYGAIGYVTKPFCMEKTVSVIIKAIERIQKESKRNEYTQYGKYWVENRRNVKENFWHEYLMENSMLSANILQTEIRKRGLKEEIRQQYHLILAGTVKTQIAPEFEEYFRFMLKNVASEVLVNDLNNEDCLTYDLDRHSCVLMLMDAELASDEVLRRCERLIQEAKRYLRVILNCYIGISVEMEKLPAIAEKLNALCVNTLVIDGKCFWESEYHTDILEKKHQMDFEQYAEWFERGQQLSIVNSLKHEMDLILKDGNHNRMELNNLCLDFLQIVHYILYQHEIQAHLVMENPALKKLFENSSNSPFDMMKWANYLTAQVIETIRAAKKTNSMTEKAKEYIAEHYSEEIDRNHLAELFYLTPDYFARIFKSECGMSVNDYINKYRIGAAKKLLMEEDYPVGEIAIRVGFGSMSYFSTIFKKQMGMTPAEFRKSVL